jgi:hypothetical protein
MLFGSAKLSIKQSEIQNSAVSLKPPSITKNIFTFTLFPQEGRAGVAWEPSYKMMLFVSLGNWSVSHFIP